MSFDIRQTNISKGVAVLMLIWSHLFIDSPDNALFVSVFEFSGTSIESYMVNYFAVCVSLFCLLSGYGMYKSYMSFSKKDAYDGKVGLKHNLSFITKHLVKLLSGFWFIYLLFVPYGLITGKTQYSSILSLIEDFFGISYLCGGDTANVTWWYMGLIILLYISSPWIIKGIEKSSLMVLVLSLMVIPMDFLPYNNVRVNLFSFVFGIFIAKVNGFVSVKNMLNNKYEKIIFCVFSLGIIGYYRHLYPELLDPLFSFVIVLATFMILSKVPVLSAILETLGKYSGSIYMFHAFIYYYYFQSFIYMFKYSIVIFLIMTLICYVIAWLLEFIKEKIYYNKLFKKIGANVSEMIISGKVKREVKI